MKGFSTTFAGGVIRGSFVLVTLIASGCASHRQVDCNARRAPINAPSAIEPSLKEPRNATQSAARWTLP